jgi:SAM-dependent methyltransferase
MVGLRLMTDPSGYGPSTYGDLIADLYDDLYGDMFDIDGTLQVLTELAGPPARVLELGIGTGRVALPLAKKGLQVEGIDASEAMVARMRAKPGGDQIPVTFGDFAEVSVDGAFELIFIVFNTLFGLGSQHEQIRCFENVAKRLTDDGVFLIECFVPDVARFDRDQRVHVGGLKIDRVMLDCSVHNQAEQSIFSQHVLISPEGTRLLPVNIRYAYPSELDLMARLAGLRLRDRWGGWRRQPFDASSQTHVSVYEKA